jgi:hypothetical protein
MTSRSHSITSSMVNSNEDIELVRQAHQNRKNAAKKIANGKLYDRLRKAEERKAVQAACAGVPEPGSANYIKLRNQGYSAKALKNWIDFCQYPITNPNGTIKRGPAVPHTKRGKGKVQQMEWDELNQVYRQVTGSTYPRKTEGAPKKKRSAAAMAVRSGSVAAASNSAVRQPKKKRTAAVYISPEHNALQRRIDELKNRSAKLKNQIVQLQKQADDVRNKHLKNVKNLVKNLPNKPVIRTPGAYAKNF